MDFKVIFDNCSLLFEYFGWYSILLVLGTFGFMIPLNLLYKKLMKKESLERLRKMVSCISVYAIALGLIALFTGVVIKAPITAGYLFGAALPCGLLAQILWATVKVIRDYGIKPILKSIAQSKEAKEWMTSVGLNEALVNTVFDTINKSLESTDTKTFEDVVAQELAITQNLRQKLSGFVDSTNMEDVVAKFMEQIKSKYPKQDEIQTETKGN